MLTSLFDLVVGTFLPFVAILTVVVFFHELGHFWVARRCGVAVKVFSIGFGPELIGFDDKQGTRWRLAAIPLGGYVRFIDDVNAASVPDANAAAVEGSFQGKSVARRAAVVAAGPIANFILAIVIYTLLFAFMGKPVSTPTVDEIQKGSVAEQAGFQVGDRILTIDGVTILGFSDLQQIVYTSADVPLTFEVDRAGAKVTLTATPRASEIKDVFGNKMRAGLLGISHKPTSITVIEYGPIEAVQQAFKESWRVVTSTLGYLGKVLTGQESTEQIGGPIGIAKVSGQAASLGIIPFINLAAILSISIGLLNLFPIPLLDGGHLVYYAIEAIRGKPLSERAQDYGFRIGFAIVLMLMVLGTFNDLVRLATG